MKTKYKLLITSAAITLSAAGFASAQNLSTELDCAQGSDLVSFAYGAPPIGWYIGTGGHYGGFNSYTHSPCVDATTMDFAGLASIQPDGTSSEVGHSGGTDSVNAVGATGISMICTGGWDTSYDANSTNDISFDLTFASDASGPLGDFSFYYGYASNQTVVGTDGFELSITDSTGATLWSSGQQLNSAIGAASNLVQQYTFDISSVSVSGGETLSFNTYHWSQTGSRAWLGSHEVTSKGVLCSCVPEPSSIILSILGAAFVSTRRSRK